ncbi:SsrA-binding protein SmpB [Candidatus Parcubacteria bacterium]|nr:SsrA-binding protein SmpB [Candidatus Parcubacteria bacterium]
MALIENRKARFNYEILEKFAAGLELLGTEVKSIRKGQGSLEGAHVIIRGKEAYLIGAHIPAWQPKNSEGYEPERNRRLLLGKKEIHELSLAENKKGLTIVPLSVYNKGRWMKIDVAIARGKKKFDKRETQKKRDTERDIRREYSDH